MTATSGKPSNETPPKDTTPNGKLSIWTTFATHLLVLIIGGGLGYLLLQGDKPGEITFSPTNGITIKLDANDSLASVLDKATQTDPAAVNGILESRRYFRLDSERLVTQLSEIDTRTEKSVKIANRLRHMLWDLKGPFRRPETLRGADSRMLAALDDLNQPLADGTEPSDFLVALWEQYIDQGGIFLQRLFPTTIKLVLHAPEDKPKIYACSGGALRAGRVIEIFTETGTTMATIEYNPPLFRCDNQSISTQQLLTGKVPIPLGLNKTAYKAAVDPNGSGEMTVLEQDAHFIFYPRHLIGG